MHLANSLRTDLRTTLLALTAAAACATAPSSTPALTRIALQSELERHTCTTWTPEANLWSLDLFDPTCAPAPSASEPAALVRAVVPHLQRLRFLADPVVFDHFYTPQEGHPPLSRPTAETLADASIWSDPRYAAAIWSTVHHELMARGLTCTDCPVPTPPPTVTITWLEFYPYLAAYIHPSQPPDGGPVQIYTCSAINGAAALPPDDLLHHAGKLTAMAFALDGSTHQQISALATGSLPAVTEALHTYLNGPGRTHACTVLTSTAWFTGLHIRDC